MKSRKKRQIFLRTAQKEYTLGQKVEEGKGREVSSSEIRSRVFLKFSISIFLWDPGGSIVSRSEKKRTQKKNNQEILSLEFDRFCEDLRKKRGSNS